MAPAGSAHVRKSGTGYEWGSTSSRAQWEDSFVSTCEREEVMTADWALPDRGARQESDVASRVLRDHRF